MMGHDALETRGTRALKSALANQSIYRATNCCAKSGNRRGMGSRVRFARVGDNQIKTILAKRGRTWKAKQKTERRGSRLHGWSRGPLAGPHLQPVKMR